MKRYITVVLFLSLLALAVPCQAQFMKKLKDGLINQTQQQLSPGQQSFLGNVNLPPGQYMMTNVQTGQAFYVMVQNGQMYLSSNQYNQMPQQNMVPGQQTMTQQGGGLLKNLIRNQLAPQTQQQQMPVQQQYQ